MGILINNKLVFLAGRGGLLALLVIGLTACGRGTVRDTPRAPVTDLSGRTEIASRAERNPVAISGRKNAAAHLVRSARRKVSAGKLSSAAGMLERAKNIDPENAVIWSNLADIRFRQGQYRDAESLALRSNSYAGSDRKLKRYNWQLIVKARAARGDKEGAARAQEKLKSLR